MTEKNSIMKLLSWSFIPHYHHALVWSIQQWIYILGVWCHMLSNCQCYSNYYYCHCCYDDALFFTITTTTIVSIITYSDYIATHTNTRFNTRTHLHTLIITPKSISTYTPTPLNQTPLSPCTLLPHMHLSLFGPWRVSAVQFYTMSVHPWGLKHRRNKENRCHWDPVRLTPP